MCVLPVYMSVHHMYAMSSESSGTGVRNICESSGCQDLDLGPLEYHSLIR